jgi:integrase
LGPSSGRPRKKLEERRSKKGNPISLVSLKRKTFTDLADEYEKNFENDPYFQKTRKYYLKTLRDHFGQMRLREIGTLELDTFKTKRKSTKTKHGKERSGIAVNRELETLNHMFNKALEWGWMEINPFRLFRESIFYEENGRLRYLEEEEIKELLAALDEKPDGKGKRKSPEYLKNIIKAAILTGMRKTDLLILKWSDYKRESGRLYFYETKKKKMTDKILSDDMIGLLESIPRGESEYIFTSPDGKALKSLQRSFRTALKRAGIKDFRFHDLRHTSASVSGNGKDTKYGNNGSCGYLKRDYPSRG